MKNYKKCQAAYDNEEEPRYFDEDCDNEEDDFDDSDFNVHDDFDCDCAIDAAMNSLGL